MLKKLKTFFYDTWYGTPLCIFIIEILLCALELVHVVKQFGTPPFFEVLSKVLVIFLGLSVLNWIVALVITLRRRKWGRALGQFFSACCVFALFIAALIALAVLSIFGPSEDNFNDTHVLPDDIAYEEPAENPNQSVPVYSKEICQDDFSLAVLKAFADTTPVDKTLSIDLGSLKNLSETRREFLLDYLAAHPGWWLHKDGDTLCATRRWKVNGNWYHPLHGYYNSWASADEGFAFQTRTTLGFPGFVLGRPKKEEIHFLESKVEIDTTKKQERKDEYICAKGEAVSLMVFDQTKINEHRITRAVLAFLKDEFEKLEKATTREEMMALLPEDAVVKGEDSFVLRDDVQPGIYNLTLRVNPGEAGTVYLKAFEVTENLPLSVGRLEDRSNERVGWSENPEEKFLSEVEFTIYEGDWEKYYAARFEVWFRPASGGEERKLMERIYKIEGWMR